MSDSQQTYDVFISHAGEDKSAIAVPLYNLLKDRGIKAFLDAEELPVGGDAPQNMRYAMQNASIGVFILSPEFAAKRWPMIELDCFLRRHQGNDDEDEIKPTLIPVFYRLTVQECKDRTLLLKNHPSKFGTRDFMTRIMEKDVDMDEIVKSLALVAKFTGIEVDDPEITSESGGEARRELIDNICIEVQKSCKEDTWSHTSRRSDITTHHGFFEPEFYAPENDRNVLLSYEEETIENEILDAVLEQYPIPGDTRIVAITGRSGVGKSCILRSLVKQPSIRSRFPGGAYYMHLGPDANQDTIAKALANAIDISGGDYAANQVLHKHSMEAIIDDAEKWFRGRRCLLLVDDVGTSNSVGLGFVSRLSVVFSFRTSSVLAVSTNSNSVATAETIIEVTNDGIRGQEIFFRYAGCSEEEFETEGKRQVMEELYDLCDGLSVCYRVVGRCISELAMYFEPLSDRPWKRILSMIRTVKSYHIPSITRNQYDQDNIMSLFYVSLLVLQERRSSRMEFSPTLSFMEMFCSICVLKKGAVVSLTFLKRLWHLEDVDQAKIILRAFTDVGLFQMCVEKDVDESGSLRMRVHDLVQEFAVICARAKCEIERWHFGLVLQFLLPEESNEIIHVDSTIWAESCQRVKGLIRGYDFTRKGLWTDDDAAYIFENLSRHITHGGNAVQLVDLILNPAWAHSQVEHGGFQAWKRDCDNCLRALESASEYCEVERVSLRTSICSIRDALIESWEWVANNPQELSYQMHARLLGLSNSSTIQRYLSALGEWQQRPWLKPFHSICPVPEVQSDLPFAREFLLDDCVLDVVLTKDERLAIVAVGKDVLAVDLKTAVIKARFEGHTDLVTTLDISEDNKIIVSGSWDNSLRIWEASAAVLDGQVFNGHTNGVKVVKFCTDSRRVVSGSADGTIRVWDVKTQEEVFGEPYKHEAEVSCLVVSASRSEVISGSWDCSIRIWSLETSEEVGESPFGHDSGITCMALTSDEQKLVTGAADFSVKIWNLSDRTQVFSESLFSIPMCMHALSGEPQVFIGTSDRYIKAIEVESRRSRESLISGHSWEIECLAVTSDGKYILSGSRDCSLRVRNSSELDSRSDGSYRRSRSRYIEQVAISPSGNIAVTGDEDGYLQFWDIESGKALGDRIQAHAGYFSTLSFSRDGSMVVSGGGSEEVVRVWNCQSRESVGEAFRGLDNTPNCAAISDDNKYVIAGTYRKAIIWSVDDGKCVGPPIDIRGGCYKVEFTADGAILFNSSGQEYHYSLDSRRGLEVRPKTGEAGSVSRRGGHRNDSIDRLKAMVRVDRKQVKLDKNVIATLPSAAEAWNYDPKQQILVAALSKGEVVCCTLISDD